MRPVGLTAIAVTNVHAGCCCSLRAENTCRLFVLSAAAVQQLNMFATQTLRDAMHLCTRAGGALPMLSA
jgi:hypothetical protein